MTVTVGRLRHRRFSIPDRFRDSTDSNRSATLATRYAKRAACYAWQRHGRGPERRVRREEEKEKADYLP